MIKKFLEKILSLFNGESISVGSINKDVKKFTNKGVIINSGNIQSSGKDNSNSDNNSLNPETDKNTTITSKEKVVEK